MTYIDRSPNQF